jgi:hypothetical protein
MTNLTTNQIKLLKAVITSYFHDGNHPVDNFVWSTDIASDMGVSGRAAGGIVAQAMKAGLVVVSGYGDEACIAVTQLGYDAYIATRDAYLGTTTEVVESVEQTQAQAEVVEAPVAVEETVAVEAVESAEVVVTVEEKAPEAVVETVEATDATTDAVDASIAACSDLVTLRTMHETEAKGAARASVLRAIKVRMGEVLLGVSMTDLAKKSPVAAVDGASRVSSQAVEAVRSVIEANRANADESGTIVIQANLLTGVSESWKKYADFWYPGHSADKVVRTLGYTGKLRKQEGGFVVVLTPAA